MDGDKAMKMNPQQAAFHFGMQCAALSFRGSLEEGAVLAISTAAEELASQLNFNLPQGAFSTSNGTGDILAFQPIREDIHSHLESLSPRLMPLFELGFRMGLATAIFPGASCQAAERATVTMRLQEFALAAEVPLEVLEAYVSAIRDGSRDPAPMLPVIAQRIDVLLRNEPDVTRAGRVFIGHGKSRVWRDLKDFLQDRLGLAWDEFNRVTAAGFTTTERLDQMLEHACFAFIIMTGEDQHSDGSLHARENVIHEAGLFQGRLGRRRAILLVEEGLAEFTNIRGLTQIRFPAGNLAAKTEDIRSVLEREGILDSGLER